MHAPVLWRPLASELVNATVSALGVLRDNIVESSLAMFDLARHAQIEASSLVRTSNWFKIRPSLMSIAQARQILDVKPEDGPEEVHMRRNALYKRLSHSPFLQYKIHEAHDRLVMSKCQ